ncbi:MAG TPA: HAD-IA family hydrolase [Acidimicrobiia bacterium]|nr:HAD-IA family hydrolase [Acidimicrobiia bacterium]
MIRAVVFDFDGLILDTEVPVYEAWAHAFETYGCGPIPMDEWAKEIGTNGALDLVAMMRARATKPFDEDEMHELRRIRREELQALEEVRPGVVQWLDDADAHGLSLAIASSSPTDWVEYHLDLLGLRSRFQFLACFGTDIAAKPEPDSYQAACRALGVEPAEAIAVEDSPHGVTAAQRAGLRCIAVPNAITAQLDLSHADVVVHSLAEFSLADAHDYFS